MDLLYYVVKANFDTYSIVRKKRGTLLGTRYDEEGNLREDESEIFFEIHIPDAGDKRTASVTCALLNEDYLKRMELNKARREAWEAQQEKAEWEADERAAILGEDD